MRFVACRFVIGRLRSAAFEVSRNTIRPQSNSEWKDIHWLVINWMEKFSFEEGFWIYKNLLSFLQEDQNDNIIGLVEVK